MFVKNFKSLGLFIGSRKNLKCLYRLYYALYIEKLKRGIKTTPRTFQRLPTRIGTQPVIRQPCFSALRERAVLRIFLIYLQDIFRNFVSVFFGLIMVHCYV
jgi:hypothetical protein